MRDDAEDFFARARQQLRVAAAVTLPLECHGARQRGADRLGEQPREGHGPSRQRRRLVEPKRDPADELVTVDERQCQHGARPRLRPKAIGRAREALAIALRRLEPDPLRARESRWRAAFVVQRQPR